MKQSSPMPAIGPPIVVPGPAPSALRTHSSRSTRFLISPALALFGCLFSQPSANAQACASSSGPLTGSSFSTSSFGGSSISWSNATGAAYSDASYANAGATLGILSSAYSDYLEVQNFGFNIPSSATICEIVVDVQRSMSTFLGLGGYVADQSVQLLKNGVLTGSDQATGAHWPSSDGNATYGNSVSTGLWGSTWQPSDVNNTNFGVALSAALHSGLVSVGMTAQVNQVSMTIHYDIGILGFSLQHFAVTRQTGGNFLSWTTSSGGQEDQFIVQRSANGTDWQSLAMIKSGNSDEAMNYTYTDGAPLNGANLYRLCLQGNAGKSLYSATLGITGNNTNIRCYPNPVGDMIHISSPGAIGSIRLTDMQGRVLRVEDPHATTYEWQFPAAGLPPGLYLVQVDDAVFRVVKK